MSKRILLIEDNTPIRENTIELLELANYEVVHAANGVHGLELLKTIVPDLILCDILMPGISGYDFLKAIRMTRQLESVPFIFFSAYADNKDIEKGLEAGATDYIIKPFEPDDLIALINKYLQTVICQNPVS